MPATASTSSKRAQLRGWLPARLKVAEIKRGQLDDVKAKRRLLSATMSGQKVINYAGHGSMTSWRGGLLDTDAARALTDADLLLVVMMSCLNG